MSINKKENSALSLLDNAKNLNSIQENNISILSNITQLDPEVAIEQVKQYEHLANCSKEMYKNQTEISKSLIESDDIETKEIFELEKNHLNSLSSLLEKDSISAEERVMIINNMSCTIQNANQRKIIDQEYRLKIQNNANTMLGIITICLASAVGATVILNPPTLQH